MVLDSRFQINGNWKKTTKGNGLERIIATVQYRTYRQHKVVRPGWERTYNAFVSTPLSQHISTLCQLARHSYVKYNKLYWIFKKSLREILKTHTLAVKYITKYAKRLTIIVISIARGQGSTCRHQRKLFVFCLAACHPPIEYCSLNP